MRKKLVLDVEALEVDSFQTSAEEEETRGTVEARQDAAAPQPCTCAYSCDCPSAIYWCAEIAWTVYSCDYTKNRSCWYTYQTCTPA